MAFDHLRDVFLAAQADDRLGQLAVLEEQQRRDTADGIPARDGRGSRPRSAWPPSRGRRTPRPAHRRSAPAGGTDRTTPPRSPRARRPCFVSSSKLPSVNVFTLSDAIVVSYLLLSLTRRPRRAVAARAYTSTYSSRRRVPRKILPHPGRLDASPRGPVAEQCRAPTEALRAAPPACTRSNVKPVP